MPDRRIAALLAAATLAAAGAVATVTMGGEESSREGAVATRGAKVMPFSLDATTHVFDVNETGGTQRVIADNTNDSTQIRLIREHLRKEAAAFKRGDFADPAAIHGNAMPGLAALKAGFKGIGVRYRDLPNGAEISYRSNDRRLAAAVADWFDAQLSDHGGDATQGSSHTSHG